MIGTNLNLTLPSTTETMAINIASIATALQAIETSLADKATPAGLNINAPLELNGNSLTEVASVQFANGNVSNVAGSLYYFNGDWYVVDTVGAIQLTDNGQLNAASIAGLKGDYGGVNPAALTYVDASGQYIFTEDTGIYADMVGDDLLLADSGHFIRITAPTLGADYTMTLPTLPAGHSMLQMDSAGVVTADNTLVATLTVQDLKFSNSRTRSIPAPAWSQRTDTNPHTFTGSAWTLANNRTDPVAIPIVLDIGDQLNSLSVFAYKGSAATDTFTLQVFKIDSLGASTTLGTATNAVNAPGAITLTVSGLTEVLATGYIYLAWLSHSNAAATGSNTASTAELTYKR